jgi:hypothetical protein
MSATIAHLDDGTPVTLRNSAQFFTLKPEARALPLKDLPYIHAVVEDERVVGWITRMALDLCRPAKR